MRTISAPRWKTRTSGTITRPSRRWGDARQDGTALALGYGVDYTSGGFSSYIDSLYPEPVLRETEGGFGVSDYVEQGGDANILRNEVGRWLNGRGTTSAEGEAFIEKYGWLFGGEELRTTSGEVDLINPRESDSRLGRTAYQKLAMAQDAATEGVLSIDDYVTFTMQIAGQMEQAGMSLQDYLSEGWGILPEIGILIEENRVLKTVQEEERAKVAAQQMRTVIEDADAAVAQGSATAEQQELVNAISSMDIVEAVTEVPGNAAQRRNLSAELTAYAETNMVGKLVSIYGSVHTVEADFAREAADNIANITLGYYDDNYKRAAMMGVDMDTCYEMYPERALSVEDAYRRAYDDYVNTWSNVWATVGKQAAAGQMVIPRASLYDTLSQAQKDSAAFDESADKTEYQGEGVGVLRVAKSSAIAGSPAAAEGAVSAVQYFITSANDSVDEAANRESYGNDPAAYREATQTAVADIIDPEEQAAWQYLLNNYEGDIFNNYHDYHELFRRAREERNANDPAERRRGQRVYGEIRHRGRERRVPVQYFCCV